jgi:UDP-glucose 4-epimerase
LNDRIGEQYAGKTVLITGGAGCIGSNLVRALVRNSAERVVIIDDLSASYEWNIPKSDRVTLIKGSILDEDKLSKAFAFKPDYVFHLAAHFANQNSVDHPEADLAVNGQGTYKVLERSRKSGVQRLVYASSGCSVYGSNAPLPLKEDFVSLHLDTPYQINKLVGELYCNYVRDYYGFPVATARYFNVYGPGEVPGRYRNVIPNFMLWAMKGKKLPITGTGEEIVSLNTWGFTPSIFQHLRREMTSFLETPPRESIPKLAFKSSTSRACSKLPATEMTISFGL